MSEDKSTVSDKQGAAGSVVDEFVEIVTERYMYNVEKCGKVPLVGFMLNLLEMPPIERAGKMMEWSAFLIKTTAPTKGIGRDETVLDLPIGSEVLIPATNELQKFMSRAATSETMVFEVRIIPKVKIDIGKGQEMWTYTLAAKPKPWPRHRFGLAAVLGSIPQLQAAGSEQPTGEEPLPF